MGGFILTTAGAQAPASVPLTSSGHAFWYGIMIVCVLGWVLGELGRVALFIVALIASGLLPALFGHGHFGSSDGLMLLLIAIGVLVGLYFGRSRGLRLLGESEFRTRWGNVLRISRWL
jgi:hypothetical protein